jgi:hypothetical protein
MPAPIDPAVLPTALLAEAAADMKAVLAGEPELGDFGFGIYHRDREKSAKEQAEKLAWNRDRLREPKSLAAFLVTRVWLRQFRKLRHLNKTGSTYGLKHVAEHDVGYITNGVFIAAALAEGFRVKRIGYTPNGYVNIPMAAWGRGWKHGDQESFFDKPYRERLAAIGIAEADGKRC